MSFAWKKDVLALCIICLACIAFTLVWLRLWGEQYLHKTRLSLFVICVVFSAAVALRTRKSAVVALCVIWLVSGLWMGTHDPFWCSSRPPTYDWYVLTVARNIARITSCVARLETLGVHPHIVMGIEVGDRKTVGEILGTESTLTSVLDLRIAALLATYLQALRNAYETSSAEWLIIFEDDAAPLRGFRDWLDDSVCRYAYADAVWLDTNSAQDWVFRGSVGAGSNAIAWRRTSVARVLAMVDGDEEHYTDHLFPALCLRGLKCAFAPLVTASEAEATLNPQT